MRGYCTFGSFNQLRKHSKRTKRTWGRVLMAMPEVIITKRTANIDTQVTSPMTCKSRLILAASPGAADAQGQGLHAPGGDRKVDQCLPAVCVRSVHPRRQF